MGNPGDRRAGARDEAGTPPLLLAAMAAAPVVVAAAIGHGFTMPNLAPWYESLAKPPFNPPNWVFGPAWSALYVLMTAAFWRILRSPSDNPARPEAIGLFLMQMVFNAVWSIAFFGLRSPESGLFVIVVLLGLIALTMRAFWKVDRPAALLLAPYIAWVGFATLLNAEIWRLN